MTYVVTVAFPSKTYGSIASFTLKRQVDQRLGAELQFSAHGAHAIKSIQGRMMAFDERNSIFMDQDLYLQSPVLMVPAIAMLLQLSKQPKILLLCLKVANVEGAKVSQRLVMEASRSTAMQAVQRDIVLFSPVPESQADPALKCCP